MAVTRTQRHSHSNSVRACTQLHAFFVARQTCQLSGQNSNDECRRGSLMLCNAQYPSVATVCCLPKTPICFGCWALSPAHCVVVNVDLPQAAHHVQLIACAINI